MCPARADRPLRRHVRSTSAGRLFRVRAAGTDAAVAAARECPVLGEFGNQEFVRGGAAGGALEEVGDDPIVDALCGGSGEEGLCGVGEDG